MYLNQKEGRLISPDILVRKPLHCREREVEHHSSISLHYTDVCYLTGSEAKCSAMCKAAVVGVAVEERLYLELATGSGRGIHIPTYMGQFPEDRENSHFVSFF